MFLAGDGAAGGCCCCEGPAGGRLLLTEALWGCAECWVAWDLVKGGKQVCLFWRETALPWHCMPCVFCPGTACLAFLALALQCVCQAQQCAVCQVADATQLLCIWITPSSSMLGIRSGCVDRRPAALPNSCQCRSSVVLWWLWLPLFLSVLLPAAQLHRSTELLCHSQCLLGFLLPVLVAWCAGVTTAAAPI